MSLVSLLRFLVRAKSNSAGKGARFLEINGNKSDAEIEEKFHQSHSWYLISKVSYHWVFWWENSPKVISLQFNEGVVADMSV